MLEVPIIYSSSIRSAHTYPLQRKYSDFPVHPQSSVFVKLLTLAILAQNVTLLFLSVHMQPFQEKGYPKYLVEYFLADTLFGSGVWLDLYHPCFISFLLFYTFKTMFQNA